MIYCQKVGDPCGCNGFGSVLEFNVAEMSKDNWWTDKSRVSFWCQLRLARAEPNLSDTDSKFQSLHRMSVSFRAGWCLQISKCSEWRARVWIINHNGTINTLFSQVLHILKMSKADGRLPAAKIWCISKMEAVTDWKGKERGDKIRQGISLHRGEEGLLTLFMTL